MTHLKKIVLILLATLVGLVLLALVVISLIPDETYKGWIVGVVSSATGRELEIGDFQLRLGGRVSIQAGDVRFANATWSSEANMVAVKRLEAEVAVWPLLRGIVDVTAAVTEPQLHIETNEQGNGNWEMGGPASEKPAAEPGATKPSGWWVVPRDIEITDAHISYRQGQTGEQHQVQVNQLAVSAKEGEHIVATLKGGFNDMPLSLDADLGAVEDHKQAQPASVMIKLDFAGLTLDAEGTATGLMEATMAEIDLKLFSRMASFEPIASLAGVDIELPAPVTLDARLQGGAETLRLADLDVGWDVEHSNLKINGHIERLLAFEGVDIAFKASSDSMPKLIEMLAVELPLPMPTSFQAHGVVHGSLRELAVKELQVEINDQQSQMQASGSVKNLLKLQGVEAEFSASTPSLAHLSKFAGTALPEMGPLDVAGRVASQDSTFRLDSLDLQLNDQRLAAKVQGGVADLLNVSGVALRFDTKASDLPAIVQAIGLDVTVPSAISVTAVGSVAGSKESLAVSGLDARVKGKQIQVEAQGTIANVVELSGIDLSFKANAANLQRLVDALGIELAVPMPAKLTASGAVQGSQDALAVSGLKARIEDPGLKVKVSGKIDNVLTQKGLALKVASTVQSLEALSKYVQQELPKLGPLELSSRVSFRRGRYRLSNMKVQLDDKQMTIAATGAVTDLLAARGISADLTVTLASLDPLAAITGLELPAFGPLQAQAHLQAPDGIAGTSQLSVTVDSDQLQAKVVGSAASLTSIEGIKAVLNLKAERLSVLGDLAGVELSEAGPLALTGSLETGAGSFKLRGFNLLVAKSDLQGQLDLRLAQAAGEHGSLHGRFDSRLIDLTEILGGPPGEETTVQVLEGKDTVAAAEAEAAGVAERLFSQQPIPFAFLQGHDADVSITAKAVRSVNILIEDALAKFKVKDGKLIFGLDRASVGGRDIDAILRLDASGEPATMKVDAAADRIEISEVVSPKSFLQGGQLIAHVDIQGSGDSPAAIMAGLNGKVTFAVKDSQIPNGFLNQFGASLLEKFNPTAKRGDTTGLDCAGVHFDVNNGIAETTRGLALQLTDVAWLGEGRINLQTEQLDIRIEPKARKGLGLSVLGSLASLIQIGGTLPEPKVLIDPAGVTKAGLNIVTAVSTGGLSLLFQGLRRKARANEEVCAKLLEAIMEAKAEKKKE